MNGFTAEKAIQKLKAYDQAEVYVSDTTVHTIYIDNSRISNVESKRDVGMMFRMTDKGKMGKASVTLNGPDAEDDCLAMSDSVLKYSPVSDKINPFAYPEQAKIAAPDVLDKKAVEVTPEDLRDIAKRLIDSSSSHSGVPVNIPRAQIRVSVTDSHVINSNGVDVTHRSSLVYGHFTSMCVRDHPGEGIETFHSTRLDLDPEAVGRSIAEKAYNAATCKEYKGHAKLPMVMLPGDGADMLLSSLGDAIDGENVKYGRSYWQEDMDKQVASEGFCVYDDPTVPAPLSACFDDEGVATSKRPVIENGILRGILRDTFCGNSTGNGFRRSSVEPMGAYERTPTIKPVNLCVKPGKYSLAQMIEQLDDAIVVEKFAAADPDGLSGGFALNVRCGHLVHKGEVVGVINNALCMGNMFDCLKNVTMIGNEPVQTGVIRLPVICYEGTELVGN